MNTEEATKAKKLASVVAAVVIAVFSASFIPMANAVQVALQVVAILLSLLYIVYFLVTSCAKTAREKGDYSCFILPMMWSIFALEVASFLPLSDTAIAILRVCPLPILIIGSIVLLALSKRH